MLSFAPFLPKAPLHRIGKSKTQPTTDRHTFRQIHTYSVCRPPRRACHFLTPVQQILAGSFPFKDQGKGLLINGPHLTQEPAPLLPALVTDSLQRSKGKLHCLAAAEMHDDGEEG
jgi:hypothetical protein